MADLDLRRILGEIAARHGIQIRTDDPALAIVALNQLFLEDTVRELGNQVRNAQALVDKAGDKAQARAGSFLVQRVDQCAGAISQKLQDDVEAAGVRAQKMMLDLHHAHSKTSFYRSLPVGLLCGVILFGCGAWAGWTLHWMTH